MRLHLHLDLHKSNCVPLPAPALTAYMPSPAPHVPQSTSATMQCGNSFWFGNGLGYPITAYSAEAMKSQVPKLTKDNLQFYVVFNQKYRVTLVFHNLSHVVNAMHIKLVLPGSRNDIIGLPLSHASVIAVRENDIVLAFYNEAFLDDDICLTLEEGKMADTKS